MAALLAGGGGPVRIIRIPTPSGELIDIHSDELPDTTDIVRS